MKEVVIVGLARTPFGSFQGGLSTLPAPELGSIAIKAALERAKVSPSQVSEVIMGNVLSAGSGQAPARQALIGAKIPNSVPALTINKVCGSGMKAVMLAHQSISLGESEVVVAGGMENMSLAPYLLPQARAGYKMGNQTVIDSMIHDGLWDPYHHQHMGQCAELCARDQSITRKDQDEFSIESFNRAIAAQKAGKWTEIVPVKKTGKKGEIHTIDADEGPAKVQFDKFPNLKPVFDPKGSITAANASSINDGAAALVLTSREYAEKNGLTPLAKITGYSSHSQAPEWFTTAPIEAVKKVLTSVGWKSTDVDLFEVNEAFAVVVLAIQRQLQIPLDRVNVWGGAIALGHPIGASGARLIATLTSAMIDRNARRGLAAVCIGGGEATAMCLERI